LPEEGCLIFSDIPQNSIFRWKEREGISLWMKPSGYTGLGEYSHEPGSNGLTRDPQGRVVFCEHGDRRVSVLETGGGKKTLADNYQGRRLNSPNDACYNRRGDLFFTDPPYGLPKGADDPRREMDFCGVYRLTVEGDLQLLNDRMSRPNGLAFSPDESRFYVANSDPAEAVWMEYPVLADGRIGDGRVFQDVTGMVGAAPGLPDGMKVDREGNIWATGPGGVHIFSPTGEPLGRIEPGEAVSNCAWGEDGGTLFLTADTYLCRIRTLTRGDRFPV
jgi:gluconolactonase